MMDFALETTFDFKFTTRAFATGIPTVLAGTPVIEIYEDNSTTQITGAETLTVDFDSVVGLNNLRIVATAANGFGAGQSYSAVISTGTVGGVSVVGETILNFTVEHQSALRPTTAGRTLDVAATGEAGLDFGNTVGTHPSVGLTTAAVDDIWDEDIEAAHGTDATAGFLLRVLGAAISNRTNNATLNALLGVADTSGFDIAHTVWDEPLTGATHAVANSAGRRVRDLQEFGVYDGGQVFLDTVGGTAGTTDFESGTAFNAVDSIADTNTLLGSLNLSRVAVAPNSDFALTVDQDGQVFRGDLWILALGGRQLNETHIIGAEVSGICTGHVHMDHCHLGASSFAQGEFSDCGLADTFTITGANSFVLTDCYHEESTAPSTIDFGAAVGASIVHVHGWKGALVVLNMDTGDVLHFSSAEGLLTLGATNTAGTLNISGTPALDTTGASVTVNDNRDLSNRLGSPAGASVSVDIADLPTVSEFNARTLPSATYFDPAADTVVNVTTVAALAAGSITAAVIATDAIDADALAADAANEIGAATWNQNIDNNGTGGARLMLSAMQAMRNRVAIAGGTMTVYEDDDTTSAWTSAITTAAGNPISESNPA